MSTEELVEVVLPGKVEPEGLRIRRGAVPAAGPGQVVIRMEATGVSFAEQQMRRGRYYDQPPFPFVPGYDLVGTDRRDDSDQVIAGHERERRLVVVAAPAHLLLGEGHVGGLHADHRLPGGGRRDRSGPRQAFRLHHAGQHDLGELLLFHVRSSTPSRCAVS